jgi:hypothetical protein
MPVNQIKLPITIGNSQPLTGLVFSLHAKAAAVSALSALAKDALPPLQGVAP